MAGSLSAFLGQRHQPVRVPAEHTHAAAARPDVPAPPVSTIAVPADRSVRLAATSLADAYAGRGLARPAVGSHPSAAAAVVARIDAGSGLTGEQFRLRRAGTRIGVTAGTAAGARAGLYTLADRVRSASTLVPAAEQGAVQRPRLGLRLTDAGAVGLDDDPARFARGDDYSLGTGRAAAAMLPAAPWVDRKAVARIAREFRAFVDRSLAQGYNAVVVDGFLEYVTFGELGVYPAGDPHPARARAMRRSFGPVWKYAHDMGMKVYLSTDMLATDPPLVRYLDRHAGGLDVDSPALWSVYRAGVAELFHELPYLAGMMIRVGEGGADYDVPGSDYSSALAVTTAAAVRRMLRAVLAPAAAAGKDVIFRSWTVGVGPVGDLHTNPDSYRRVLGSIHDRHLIVSTKYSAGDFYSHLALNPTLAVGDQRRIVEIQSRREFEGLGALPDDLGALDQTALRRLLADNPHIEGVWDWAQEGGPLYAGPRAMYLRHGFWQLWDLNVYLAARLAWHPDLDLARARADWVRQTLATDPAAVRAISAAFALSRTAITDGLYIGPYADRSVTALGLHPPPMMWIFEWDIVSGDSATFDTIYQICRGHLDEAIEQGRTAVRVVRRMRALIAGTDPGDWTEPALRGRFLAALDYQQSLFRTLAAYRTLVLRHAEWLDTGSHRAYDAWHAAQREFVARRAQHRARYGDSLALPAYNFTAAELGLARADRDVAMAWLSRALLAITLLALAAGAWAHRGRPGAVRSAPGATAVRGLWLGATRPWRLAELDPPRSRTDRLLVWALPAGVLVLSRAAYGWFASPVHLVGTLGAWLLYAVVLRALLGRRAGFRLWAALGGVALLRSALLLAVLSVRGPGRYWFDFWNLPGRRAGYVVLAVAAFGWLFVASFGALRAGYRLRRRRAAGAVLVAAGTPLAVLGALVAAIGLETVLTWWNDQLNLLPWGLSRILGLTVYLGIPTALPSAVGAAGVALGLAGGLLLVRRRHRPAA
ncbi:hypothetical protein Athai_27240 [Actinocatenispora thailandica]|uniref:Glycosyl hydrolase family 67 C-terminal domain-containing protein n=1 Tax=Actinocatenispora thailandica TaxID=227318 RepID=A0A7R7DPC5_9ACTN|nr:hypothetical protein Athai_27240 [Actinocatenispora thailandica]